MKPLKIPFCWPKTDKGAARVKGRPKAAGTDLAKKENGLTN